MLSSHHGKWQPYWTAQRTSPSEQKGLKDSAVLGGLPSGMSVCPDPPVGILSLFDLQSSSLVSSLEGRKNRDSEERRSHLPSSFYVSDSLQHHGPLFQRRHNHTCLSRQAFILSVNDKLDIPLLWGASPGKSSHFIYLDFHCQS